MTVIVPELRLVHMLQKKKYAESSGMLRECGRIDTVQNGNDSNRIVGHTFSASCIALVYH